MGGVGPINEKMRRARSNLAAVGVAAIVSGWLGHAVDRAAGTSASGDGLVVLTPGVVVWLLLPAAVAWGAYAMRDDGAGDLGWSPLIGQVTSWSGRVWSISLFFYLGFGAVVAGLGILVGASHPPLSQETGDLLLRTLAFVALPLLVKSTFEETVFRGYGTRTAAVITSNPLVAHLLVGVLWWAWQVPYLLFLLPRSALGHLTALPPPVFLALTGIGLLAFSIVLGELRLLTRSIWPGVLLSTTGGMVAATLLTPETLQFEPWADLAFSPTLHSLAGIGCLAVVAVSVRRWRLLA